MNTRVLMIASALAMGAAGLAATFAPAELLVALNVAPVGPLPVLIQLLGALYVGFALANWTAKANVIGGIYSRPLSLANCVHFVAGALALLKYTYAAAIGSTVANALATPMTVVLAIYLGFAACFTYLVFGMGAACKVAAR
jgi:hypothetical protein